MHKKLHDGMKISELVIRVGHYFKLAYFQGSLSLSPVLDMTIFLLIMEKTVCYYYFNSQNYLTGDSLIMI